MAKDAFNDEAKTYTIGDLKLAIRDQQLSLVKEILASRQVTDIDEMDAASWTPLLQAVATGNRDIVAALIDGGARVNAPEPSMGHTPLSRAVSGWYGGKPAMVSLLLSRGADPNILPINPGEGPLLSAAEKGYETIMLMLLGKGAAIEQEDTWGKTAIHVAAEHGQAAIIRILAEHGAELDKLGALALSKAISAHSREAFDALIECGANPLAPLRGRKTLLMVAAETGVTGVMPVLVEKGVDLDCADENGKTALMLAAEAGISESVRKLLALGANPALTTPDGKTARQLAEEAGHDHILYTIDNAPRKDAPASTRPFRIKLAAKNGFA
ncbi:MAG: ankyrin repeat domain-containing protein [Alphaproteobacteria bacterium]